MFDPTVMIPVKPETRAALHELKASRGITYDQLLNEFLVLYGVPSSDKPAEFTEVPVSGWGAK